MTAYDDWLAGVGAYLKAHPMPTDAAPTPAPPPTTAAPNGGSIVFHDEFRTFWSSAWVSGKSSAYPNMGPTNPSDNKLDYLAQTALMFSDTDGLTITATKRSDGYYATGLLTTEGSQLGFKAKTGDYLEIDCTLPAALGAWPALWTWANGGNEVDVFEYHPDNPNLLELTNHVKPVGTFYDYYTDTTNVGPGKRVKIGALCGASSVAWYVNGKKVWADTNGVGSSWSANLIVNLSVAAGKYGHAAPTVDLFQFKVHGVAVYR